ncbi:LysR family transcriptional regulator [Streptomyces sp. bgisy022]|uniref:LysR family transcriptional regulator n=1 Tax=Streptomyces sp. bgisy022 TaxID=3413769 RepID=UPI003D72B1EE
MIVKPGFTMGERVIERHEAEAFLTLAEELHFGRTAAALHVSTARVSQTIRKLERRVGVPLFHRTSRRVSLTEVGKQLHDELRPAWDALGAAVHRATETGRGLTGVLRVDFVSAAAAQLLAGAAQLFREQAPECEVRIQETQAHHIPARIHAGESDLGLTTLPLDDPGLTHGRVLIREAHVLAVPSTHPYARRDSVRAADLARVPLVRLPGHTSLPPHRRTDALPVPGGPTAETLQEALTLVGAGQGTLPAGAHTRRYYPRPDIAYLPISDAPALTWALVWPAVRTTARVRSFVEAADRLIHGDEPGPQQPQAPLGRVP